VSLWSCGLKLRRSETVFDLLLGVLRMWLVYIDDSRDENFSVFSALAIHSSVWKDCFVKFREYRRLMKNNFGILIYKEWHATDFVAGRGRISPKGTTVSKFHRSKIFLDTLSFVADWPLTRLFNAKDALRHETWLFERLLNRIQRTMVAWNETALIISDKGKEGQYTKLLRKMSVHNPIPSMFGVWRDTGKLTKNITTDRIIEDIIFKDSAKSFFVQIADFCAFSLLRKEAQLPSRNKYGIHLGFDRLDKILVKEASRKDPQGIIRI
jgi:hypothetical protein